MPELMGGDRRLLVAVRAIKRVCELCPNDRECDTCPLSRWANSLDRWNRWVFSRLSEDVHVFCSNRCGPLHSRCQDLDGDGTTCCIYSLKHNANSGYGK